MPIMELITFIVNHISTIACICLLVVTQRNSVQSSITKLFKILTINMLVLNVGTLLQTYDRYVFGGERYFFVVLCYIGICLFPVLVFYLGMLFKDPHMAIGMPWILMLILPLVSLTFIIIPELRDNYFFINYSTYSNEAVYGSFYYIHSVYSYIPLFFGIVNVITSSVKSAGFFSRQSLIISLGMVIAVAANVLYSFNIIPLTFDITACAITVAVLCFSVAIIKYKFLSVTPIALKKIVDIISDGFVVIDVEYRIIDFNNSIFRLFNNGIRMRVNQDIREVIANKYSSFFEPEEIEESCASILKTRQPVTFEKHFTAHGFDKYFSIEMSPVFSRGSSSVIVGIIILFKDATRSRKDLEIIQETMAVMLERERLATLGQMVGGFAHNIKTPIMSISGGLEAIHDLAKEYDSSIDDPMVTPEDHHEIANEIVDWIGKIKLHCSYISDIISTIKGQAVHLNVNGTDDSFRIDEFLKRLELLEKFELKKTRCNLKMNIEADVKSEIKGEINSLVQIFDNLIQNSIYEYHGKEGEIDLTLTSEENNVVFRLTDYGTGMPEHVKNKLFKEMITTKGKNGTGLGLYMSYATIKGNFNGSMEVESTLGTGTTFTIKIPCFKRGKSAK